MMQAKVKKHYTICVSYTITLQFSNDLFILDYT